MGKFPLGTMEDVIGLPTQIEVKTADGEYHLLGLEWDLSQYNKAEVGEYVLYGVVQGSGYYFENESLQIVEATITITDQLFGTADIVFVLDISGSMSDEIARVKNNMSEFARLIEEQGISARWSVVTYSDEFDVPGDKEHEKSQFVNGVDWYTNASDAESAISTINTVYGGDEFEVAIDGLMFAHENLTTRRDARVFYILLTDAGYKSNNNYGLSGMSELNSILVDDSICVSVITYNSLYTEYYSSLVSETKGEYFDISGDFAESLNNVMISKINEHF